MCLCFVFFSIVVFVVCFVLATLLFDTVWYSVLGVQIGAKSCIINRSCNGCCKTTWSRPMASSTFNTCIYTCVYSCIYILIIPNVLVILQRSMSLLRQIPPSDITISANAVVYLIGGFNIRKWSLDFTTSWKMQAVALATDVLRVESEHLTTLFGSQATTTHYKSTWLKLIRMIINIFGMNKIMRV